jgi:hypothetical protein
MCHCQGLTEFWKQCNARLKQRDDWQMRRVQKENTARRLLYKTLVSGSHHQTKATIASMTVKVYC